LEELKLHKHILTEVLRTEVLTEYAHHENDVTRLFCCKLELHTSWCCWPQLTWCHSAPGGHFNHSLGGHALLVSLENLQDIRQNENTMLVTGSNSLQMLQG
jgi:hypothetical protein